MHTDSLIGIFLKVIRRRRMRQFADAMEPTDQSVILDVGGTPLIWQFLPEEPRVVLLNLFVPPDAETYPERFKFMQGDGCTLGYQAGEFEITCSNSVIEHTATWENQRRFAEEIRRVGKKVWVQTPARCFPLEPHYLTPLIHWLPRGLQKKLLRNFSVWGWLMRPTQEKVNAVVEEIRLLSYSEMQQLFPDCEIRTERFLGWPKAYIAVRTAVP